MYSTVHQLNYKSVENIGCLRLIYSRGLTFEISHWRTPKIFFKNQSLLGMYGTRISPLMNSTKIQKISLDCPFTGFYLPHYKKLWSGHILSMAFALPVLLTFPGKCTYIYRLSALTGWNSFKNTKRQAILTQGHGFSVFLNQRYTYFEDEVLKKNRRKQKKVFGRKIALVLRA